MPTKTALSKLTFLQCLFTRVHCAAYFELPSDICTMVYMVSSCYWRTKVFICRRDLELNTDLPSSNMMVITVVYLTQGLRIRLKLTRIQISRENRIQIQSVRKHRFRTHLKSGSESKPFQMPDRGL